MVRVRYSSIYSEWFSPGHPHTVCVVLTPANVLHMCPLYLCEFIRQVKKKSMCELCCACIIVNSEFNKIYNRYRGRS